MEIGFLIFNQRTCAMHQTIDSNTPLTTSLPSLHAFTKKLFFSLLQQYLITTSRRKVDTYTNRYENQYVRRAYNII